MILLNLVFVIYFSKSDPIEAANLLTSPRNYLKINRRDIDGTDQRLQLCGIFFMSKSVRSECVRRLHCRKVSLMPQRSSLNRTAIGIHLRVATKSFSKANSCWSFMALRDFGLGRASPIQRTNPYEYSYTSAPAAMASASFENQGMREQTAPNHGAISRHVIIVETDGLHGPARHGAAPR